MSELSRIVRTHEDAINVTLTGMVYVLAQPYTALAVALTHRKSPLFHFVQEFWSVDEASTDQPQRVFKKLVRHVTRCSSDHDYVAVGMLHIHLDAIIERLDFNANEVAALANFRVRGDVPVLVLSEKLAGLHAITMTDVRLPPLDEAPKN